MNLFFADEKVSNGEQSGYVLGSGDHQIVIYDTNVNLLVIEKNFQGTSKDVFRFKTDSMEHLVLAHSLTEFIGTSYIDALARVAFGISNFTLDQISRLFRCQWVDNGGMVSGSAWEWMNAGSLTPVMFTPGVSMLGDKEIY